MLPASRHVEGLYLTPDADGKTLLDRIAKTTVVIDCSTISPQSARKVAEAARARGIEMLDAPVSGGTGRCGKRHADVHRRGRCRGARARAADPRKDGHEHLSRGCAGRGSGREDLQQHAARDPHDRNRRGARARRCERPRSGGVVGDHEAFVGRQLVAERLQPVSGCDGGRPGVARLFGRLPRRPDDQGPRPCNGRR